MSATTSTYTGLITSEHNQQPNFVATVALSVQPFVDGQNVLGPMPSQYDLDNAVGVQLDTVGIWVGRSRNVETPLPNVYFSGGVTGLGWGQGVWKGPFDPTQGLTSLDDDTYRLLLRAVIAANNWDGSIPSALAALANIFNDTETPGTLLWIEDGLDMTMTFVLSGEQPPVVFQAILATGLVPLKPGGVEANYVMTSVYDTPVFAWGMDNSYGAGWGTGAWAVPLST
jgi:hypothetical protein